LLFFSVDIYTCKQFDEDVVIEFTSSYFHATKTSAKAF
jgi:hypothetical protein